MSTTASPEHCMAMLTRLRGMVRIPKDMAAADLDTQVLDYARVLARFDPRDVEAGCLGWAERSKWWPTLAELRQVVDDLALTRRQRTQAMSLPAIEGSPYAADYKALGAGLQVARGKVLIGDSTNSAAAAFDELVAILGGVQAAARAADDLYHRQGHEAVLPGLEAVAWPDGREKIRTTVERAAAILAEEGPPKVGPAPVKGFSTLGQPRAAAPAPERVPIPRREPTPEPEVDVPPHVLEPVPMAEAW